MTDSKKWTFVQSPLGDWTAIYLRGVLVAEGHSVSAKQLLECVDEEPETIEMTEGEAEDGVQLPRLLGEYLSMREVPNADQA